MQITIQGHGLNVRDELKDYINKELKRCEKYFDRIINADVVLEGKLHQKVTQVKLIVPDNTLIASETTDKFETGIELVVDKLVDQLKKYKEKLRRR